VSDGTTELTNEEDWINASDLRARIAWLEARADSLGEMEDDELRILQALAAQVGVSRQNATLIRDSYFTEYAREMAEENGLIAQGGGWPGSHVDWDAAAAALRIDYAPADFGGVTYWIS
jgi:hypothetical protein